MVPLAEQNAQTKLETLASKISGVLDVKDQAVRRRLHEAFCGEFHEINAWMESREGELPRRGAMSKLEITHRHVMDLLAELGPHPS